ncbi:hypothetical protein VNO77_42406 [Canavalia gladiata]|uniref:Knottins-like domain-containing protein n=1 Tax=Canavalia gladiata TaxID=3824 RepID=A0AAN9JS88_CANGL
MAFSAPKFFTIFMLLSFALLLFSTWGKTTTNQDLNLFGLVLTREAVEIIASERNTQISGFVFLKALVLLASASSTVKSRQFLVKQSITMPSSTPKFFTIFMLLCLALLLFSTSEVQANLCQRFSTTWSGPCLDTGSCKDQCINVEHATFGACHINGFGSACFCYFNC